MSNAWLDNNWITPHERVHEMKKILAVDKQHDHKLEISELLERNPEVSISLKLNSGGLSFVMMAEWNGEKYGKAVAADEPDWMRALVNVIRAWQGQKVEMATRATFTYDEAHMAQQGIHRSPHMKPAPTAQSHMSDAHGSLQSPQSM